jgi:Anti-sigma-K factor rskA/Putative zinc-finger
MGIEHDQLEDAVAALVLGCAPAGDEARLRAHLRSCPGCRELAARLGRGASSLAISPDPVEPPARLQGRVRAAAAAVRDRAEPPTRRDSEPIRLRRPHPRPSWAQLGVAAAAAVTFALGAGLGLGTARVLPAGGEVARHQLTGTGPMAGVHGTALQLERDGLTVVDLERLPPLASGQVYELWTIAPDGMARPAAVFVPEGDGSKVLLLTRDLSGVRSLAVTAERGPDGAPAPTQAPHLVGQLG